MTDQEDTRPRCGIPRSVLSPDGKITQVGCRNLLRRDEPRCWKHMDLFAWAAAERKVRERQRIKRRAKDRGWSVEKLATLSETRQLDLLVWRDAYEQATQQKIRELLSRRIDGHESRPDVPDTAADRTAWDRYFAASDAYERRAKALSQEWEWLGEHARLAADRAVLEHGWPGWGTLRWLVYERDHGICFVCDREIPFEAFELGHLQDRMMGGSDRPDNVVVMCYRCNHLHKPLHETPEDAREWAAACRRRFRQIWATPVTFGEEFAAQWSRLSQDARERLVEDALAWPDQVEAARLEMRAARSSSLEA